MEEAVNGRIISQGIDADRLGAGDLCDLILFWLIEGEEDEGKAMRKKAKFEVPPKGYRGSLRGTSWDPDVLAAQVSSTSTVAAGEM